MKSRVVVYFKDGTTQQATYLNNVGGGMYDFALTIDGEEREFTYLDTKMRCEPASHKWRERDYVAEGQQGIYGIYKDATLDFDRIEVSYTLE